MSCDIDFAASKFDCNVQWELSKDWIGYESQDLTVRGLTENFIKYFLLLLPARGLKLSSDKLILNCVSNVDLNVPSHQAELPESGIVRKAWISISTTKGF